MNRVYSLKDGLGRYECRTAGSSKFWECWPDADQPGRYATRWGKIGMKHSWQRCKKGLSPSQALDKINEKRAEYSFIHCRYTSVQEAVADEVSRDMKTKTAQVAPETDNAHPPAPVRRF